jgi:hypothetical protein
MDIQLENKKREGDFIFVEDMVTPRGERLVMRFCASWERYDATRLDNEVLNTEMIDATAFSAWWHKRAEEGWTIAKPV